MSEKTEPQRNQHARFVEAAREAGADVDTSAADTLMGRLAKTPPEPKANKPSRVKTAKEPHQN